MDETTSFAKTAIPIRWSELVAMEADRIRANSETRSNLADGPDLGVKSAESVGSTEFVETVGSERSESRDSTSLPTQRVAMAVQALGAAVTQWEQTRQTLRQQWEERLFLVAVAIARKILQRELERTSPISIEKIREILELAVGASSVSLHLHPDDLAYLRDVSAEGGIGEINGINKEEMANSEISESLRAVCGSGRGRGILSVEADATVLRGGCRLVFPHGSVEAGPESELQRILEEWAPLNE